MTQDWQVRFLQRAQLCVVHDGAPGVPFFEHDPTGACRDTSRLKSQDDSAVMDRPAVQCAAPRLGGSAASHWPRDAGLGVFLRHHSEINLLPEAAYDWSCKLNITVCTITESFQCR